MKKVFQYIIFIFFCITNLVNAQESGNIGYKLVEDEVIFTFDVRDYKKATKNDGGKQIDFEDLDIYNVSVAGEFNNWSRNKWGMIKTGDYTYELRKKLKDIEHSFSWEFKFVINGEYWAEPDKKINNISWAKKDGFWLSVYNLKMYTATPDNNGNAHFYLDGYTHAKQVVLSGSFNKWNEQAFKMKKTDKGWKLTLKLDPDQYEYKFIVDGKWMHDEKNSRRRLNRFLNYNSIITIKKSTNFLLKGFDNAKKVSLAGTFNNWKTNNIPMKKTDSGWFTSLNLKGGKCQYKFIVDGNWITDPENPIKEYDSHGFINSVKMVK